MALSRIAAVLAKIESVYGTDPTPAANLNAILATNIQVTPLVADVKSRDLLTPYLGGQAAIHMGVHSQVSFDVEIAGAITGGTAPAYGPLLRACGLSETITAKTAAATIANSPATGVGGPTGTWTYTKTTAYAGHEPRTVTLLCTTPGGTGTAAFTVSAPAVGTLGAYSQTGVVMTNGAAFTLPNGAQITPTIGTSFDADDEFTIVLSPAKVVYAPVSSAFESVTLWLYKDGTRHVLRGARGNCSLKLTAGELPKYSFTLTGFYDAASAQANPAPDFSGFHLPQGVSYAATPKLTLHGQDLVGKELGIDLANSVAFRDLIGSQDIRITDRQTKGSVNFEAPAIGTKDWFATAVAGTQSTLLFKHGTAAGSVVQIDAPAVQVLGPKYASEGGVDFIAADLSFIPTSAGNDEVTITVK